MPVVVDGTNGITYPNGITMGAGTSSPVSVAQGGTGAATLTGYVKGAGTAAMTAAAAVPLATDVSGTLPVANGGTGATTLTTNNVILGNGLSAVQFVAPGSNGNVLVSNGTTWTSGGAGVTSAVAGNGITVSAATGAVTISQNFYTGSSSTNTSFPISSYLFAVGTNATTLRNSSTALYYSTTSPQGNGVFQFGSANGVALSGTWSQRGNVGFQYCCATGIHLMQRTA